MAGNRTRLSEGQRHLAGHALPAQKSEPESGTTRLVVFRVGWGSGCYGLLSEPLASIGRLFSSGLPRSLCPRRG